MKITMYELLGMLKDGKAPKKIKCKGRIYNYEDSDYFASDCGYLFDRYNVSGMLNDEVDILEEAEKKIPEKLEYYDDSIAWVIDGIGQLSDVDKVIVDKLNEVLDYLKSKGE